jgi:hypothetical protein
VAHIASFIANHVGRRRCEERIATIKPREGIEWVFIAPSAPAPETPSGSIPPRAAEEGSDIDHKRVQRIDALRATRFILIN